MNNIQNMFKPGDYIQEAVSPIPGVLIMVCTVGDNYDDPVNRVLKYRDDSWIDFGLAGEVFISIDATKNGEAYVLGENGTICKFSWRVESQDDFKGSRCLIENDVVADVGPLRQVRLVGDKVICGGSVGQVYWLNGDHFEPLPKLTIGGIEPTIEGICGSSVNDFIVVTSEGLGAYFDGFHWHDLDFPTNASLTSVCRLDGGDYAIAGYNGTILLGNREQWSIIEPIDDERMYWGIATLNGTVYASHSGGIDIIRDDKVTPLEIPKANLFEFTGLANGADGIWSCSGQTIGLITTDGWRTIVFNPV